MSDLPTQRCRFGLFEFDLATRELRREGALVRLQAQPAQVLCYLIEHAGRVVTREELRSAIWGSDTFVDFERGLNFCISQVRSALRDDATNPQFIRTLPRQGYQFIAPLERLAPGPSATANLKEQADGQASAVTSPRKLRPLPVLLAAGIVLGILLLAAYTLRSKHIAGRPPVVAILRFDNETGDPALDRFSDGLTDNVIEQLTSAAIGHYAVIGNAQILRLPRAQRDLTAVHSSLGAGYVVLGQVQSNGKQVRILAHLIRLPEQTHLRVVRMERPMDDPLAVESEIAHAIALQFSSRVSADAGRSSSHVSANP